MGGSLYYLVQFCRGLGRSGHLSTGLPLCIWSLLLQQEELGSHDTKVGVLNNSSLLCLSLEFCFLDVYPSSASPKVLPESQCVEKHILSTPL